MNRRGARWMFARCCIYCVKREAAKQNRKQGAATQIRAARSIHLKRIVPILYAHTMTPFPHIWSRSSKPRRLSVKCREMRVFFWGGKAIQRKDVRVRDSLRLYMSWQCASPDTAMRLMLWRGGLCFSVEYIISLRMRKHRRCALRRNKYS